MNGRHEFHAPPSQWTSRPKTVEQAEPSPPVFAGFVDDTLCAECHAEISAMYARSSMSRSWRSIDESLADTNLAHVTFSSDAFVDDTKNGYRYRVFREDGRIYQEETLLDPALSPGHELRHEAHYVVGSGNHAHAFVTGQNGFLTAMPLNWFANDQRWGLNPGYEQRNLRFDRPITSECIACHGTSADVATGSQHRYTKPVAAGISCQRCHGAGDRHVAYWRENTLREREKVDLQEEMQTERHTGDTIVNPAKLTAQRGNDVCLQCHVIGDVTLELPGRHAFSFHPGQDLQDHRVDLLMKTDRPEAFGVASHGARLMQSRCYLESEQKLTCFACHNPHQALDEVPRSFFDARCIDCHQPDSCAREAEPASKLRAEGCVDCHMPRRSTREGLHLVFTDHLIRRGSSDHSGDAEHYPEPESIAPDADIELVSVWPDREVDARRLGSGYIQLHETMPPQLTAVHRGVSLLLHESRQNRLDADGGYWLGSGLISLGRPADAVPILEQVVDEQPHNLRARFRLGIAYDASQRPADAIREYERILKTTEVALDPYSPLARLYLQQGRFEDAVTLLERRHRVQATAESYSQLAVARHAAGSPPQQCLPLIEQALRYDPRYINAHLTEAQFRLILQQPELAKLSFLRVLKIDPQNAHARTGLQSTSEATETAE